MQQNEGVYISPLLAASTNHVAFYSSIITGFEGRKKRNKTFHVFCRSGCVSRMLSFVAGLKLLFVRCRMYQMLTFAFLGICFARRLIRVCLLRRLGTSLCFQLHLECAAFSITSPLPSSIILQLNTLFMIHNKLLFRAYSIPCSCVCQELLTSKRHITNL